MKDREKTFAYFDIISAAMESMVMPILEKHQAESQEVIMNSILAIDGKKAVIRNNSPKENFIANKLFRPMTEILNSLESIENIAFYTQNFPYEDEALSKVSYLKYHVENYLNEIYLLKNRMIAYLKLLVRAYKKSKYSEYVFKTISPLFSLISKGLDGYIKIRGAHVHENRYSDIDFDRLTTLEFFANRHGELSKPMSHLLNRAYTETETKWVDNIKQALEGIKKIIEFYFSTLIEAITEGGLLIFPNNLT